MIFSAVFLFQLPSELFGQSVTISDVTVAEPIRGTTNATFLLTLSYSPTFLSSVDYTTVSGTAQAGADFLTTSGTVRFLTGVTNLAITVPVLADSVDEQIEQFTLVLGNPTGLTIEKGTGVGTILNTPVPHLSSFGRAVEPLSPSSRATDLVISEIMYNPPLTYRGVPGVDLDWVEVCNAGAFPIDVSGYSLTGDILCAFPENTILAPGAYLVAADKPASFAAVYGFTNVLNFNGSLPDNGGRVRLRNRAGRTLLEVNYDNQWPWPLLANGKGRSLVLARPSYGENDPRAWQASEQEGGSPLAPEPRATNSLRLVRINELLANSQLPDFDFIELYNQSDRDVDISGCILSDSPDTPKFVFQGTTIPAHSYLALDEVSLDFKLSLAGDTVYFRAPTGEILDVAKYEAQLPGVSFGRFPEGSEDWVALFPPTPFAQNATLYRGEMVINEIMYAPISGNESDQFIELYNRGTNLLNLAGWRLSGDISLYFASDFPVPPGAYFVIGRDLEQLRRNFPYLNSSNSYGNFFDKLGDMGGRLTLSRPVMDNSSNVVLAAENEITFGSGGAWGQWSRHGGSSLELIDSHSDNQFADSWADSDQSTNAPWTTLEYTGSFIAVLPSVMRQIQLVRFGAGECLVDSVELFGAGGANLVIDGGFENGATNWRAEGNHAQSALSNESFTGSWSLRLASSGAGEPVTNCVRSLLTASPSGTVTLRARARWLRGDPRILLRVPGTDIEVLATLSLPSDLGTPGRQNTRSVTNAGPAITAVAHLPIIPAANSNIVVSATLSDPDGIQSAVLHYQVNNSTGLQVQMTDDGTGGDEVANDGIYTGLIPGQPSGTMVMFYVEAFDNASTAGHSVFPEQAPGHPAILRVGESSSSGSFATWRIWMTPTSAIQWSQMGRSSDEPVSCTVVYGNQRVIHNAQIRFAGEMLDRANPSLPPSYVLILPADDKIFGIEELFLEPASSVVSFLRAKLAASLAERSAVAYGHQRYAQVAFNGLPPQPVSERQVIDSVFAQSIDATKPLGKLYSAEQWFERDPALGIQTVQSARLTLTPLKTPGRYRWNWPAAPSSDYGDFFTLLDAMDAPAQTYADHLKAFIDVEKWMDSLALIHVLGEQDVLGYGQGKNAALYRPSADRWLFIPDSFQNAFASPVTDSLFSTSDPAVAHLLSSPDFVRFYWQAVQKLLAGGFDSASVGSSIDAIASVFHGNGTPLVSSSILNWVDSRRNWILSQIPTNDFTLTTETSLSVATNLITISGTASPSTRVLINGSDRAVVWTSPSNWTATVFVRSGLNVMDVNAVGFNGLLSSTRITATVTLPNVVLDKLVINEVMHSPPVPGGGFIELFNANDWPLDLSSLQIREANFSFPSGTWIPQKGYVVVAENRSAFIEAYGNAIPVIGDAGPGLSRSAGAITLIDSLSNMKVQRIQYDSTPPWPLAANGASLQLRDWRQDATRVCNWAAVPVGDPRPRSTPGTTNSAAVMLPDLPRIYLNELQAVNTGIVADQGGRSLPWLELFGASQDVSLAGWYLTDDYANPRKWAFAATDLLPAGGYLLVWNGPGSGALHANFGLSPAGGRIALVKDDPGVGPLIVDFMNYPQIDAGESYGSFPNGPGARDLVFPSTPGAPNPPPPVFINEWMASNARIVDPSGGGSDDWFELFNAGSHVRDISGYQLGDSAGNLFSVPTGTTIPGRGFLLCWADKDVSRNRPGVDLHVNFALKAGGDQIRFLTEDGTTVDHVIFSRQTTDISQGRWPDGTPELHFMPMATPGAWNKVTNTSPPLISEIADQILVVGQTLNLQLTATDGDSPLQTFTFSLPSGAPVGVGLQANGRLTWTPSTEQAPSTNRISVEVTDQGFPPSTGSATFTAIVGLRPTIEQVVRGQGSGGLSLLFRGVPGKSYALDYKDSLEDGQWTRVPGTISGTTGLVSVPLPTSTNAQRFFKIEVTN